MTSWSITTVWSLNPGWKFPVNCLLICLRFKYPNETRRYCWILEHGLPSPRWEGILLAVGAWAFKRVRTWDWQHHGYGYYSIISANGKELDISREIPLLISSLWSCNQMGKDFLSQRFHPDSQLPQRIYHLWICAFELTFTSRFEMCFTV